MNDVSGKWATFLLKNAESNSSLPEFKAQLPFIGILLFLVHLELSHGTINCLYS